ncbi:unnamed protein product [Heterobilharzia americana]|nr:unnamed protein product [Heterobilharzia americana]
MPALGIRHPSGHKVTVELSPSAPLIQALEKACRMRGLDPSKYRLSHNGHPVDLSQSFRLSGLVNHADLELVLSDTRDQHQSIVRICFRFDNGQRVEWSGSSDTFIWSVLEQLAPNNSRIEEIMSSDLITSGISCPAVIYFQEKVVGEASLRTTTLANLGIIRGSALLQLDTVPCTSKTDPSSQYCASIESSKIITSKDGNIVENMELDTPMHQDISNKDTHTTDKNILESRINSASPHFGNAKPQLATSSNQVIESDHDYDNLNNIPEITPMDESTFTGFVSPFSVFADRPSTSAFANVGQIETRDPPGEQNKQPRTEFKFPAQTEGENLNSKVSNPDEESPGDSTVDREVVIFRRSDNVLSGKDVTEDLPDEFFEHTEEDVRRLLRSYHNEWASSEPLQTAAMRSEAHRKYYTRYSRAVIQFHWIDSIIVQACFSPSDKVSELYGFLRGLHRNAKYNFQLYTTPPKLFLSDKNITLVEANLVPLSKVFYDPIETRAEDVLLPDVLEKITEGNFAKAQSIVSKWMTNLKSRLSEPSSSSGRRQSARREPEQRVSDSCSLPKWLRLGK